LLVLVPLIEWWRWRRYPVWILLPAGLLVWILTHLAGNALTTHSKLFGAVDSLIGIVLINLVLTVEDL
jgi:Ca2+/H+ antiporter